MESFLGLKVHSYMDSASSLILAKEVVVVVVEARFPSRNHRLGGFLPPKESI